LGSHLLFWLWYDEHYHHDKLAAVLTFQLALFLIFLTAHLVGRLLRRLHSTTLEDIWLLAINPFVFFASVYHLLNPSYHDWMGVFAILMALIYAAAAKLLLDRTTTNRVESLSLIGIALTFVTIAIPIQLHSNWITIAWSIEALAMLWAGIETRSLRLRASACLIFALAFLKLLLWDTTLRVSSSLHPNLQPLLSFISGCHWLLLWGRCSLSNPGETKEGIGRELKVCVLAWRSRGTLARFLNRDFHVFSRVVR
jgi:uncharacterized membrane protein